MKKHIVIIAVLLVFSIGASVILGSEINATRNSVVITENIIFGDKNVAYGLTVSELSQYAYHLFWDTEYKIGAEPSVLTEYSYYSSEKRDSTIVYHGLNVGVRDAYGCNFTKPIEEQFGIAKAYKELYDDTLPGEYNSKVIKLIDYYDYYPIAPDVDIPDLYWTNISYEDLSDEYKSEKAVYDRFVEFFKIPMLETETVSISVGKDIYGNISTTGSGNAYSDEVSEVSDYYSPQTVSTYNETICYFSFSNRTYKGDAVDTSGIEGGYGIYKINYTQGKYKNEKGYFDTGIDPSSLATCFPLDENYAVNEMWLSHDGAYLFCILLDTDENAIFMQINTETMEAVSTLPFQSEVPEYGVMNNE